VPEGFAQGEPQPRTAEEVVKKLQGTWKVVRLEEDGNPLPPALVDALPTVTFRGKDFTWGDGETGKIIAIDATKNPITIDYLNTSGARNGNLDLAIIQFAGDSITGCASHRDGVRPNQFNTLQGSGKMLVTYQPTTEQRGRGVLLNPWFYLGIYSVITVGVVGFAVLLIVVLLRLLRQPRSNEKQSFPPRYQSRDHETDRER
jgi:uncharacterized protein (TIGR03067 family)